MKTMNESHRDDIEGEFQTSPLPNTTLNEMRQHVTPENIVIVEKERVVEKVVYKDRPSPPHSPTRRKKTQQSWAGPAFLALCLLFALWVAMGLLQAHFAP